MKAFGKGLLSNGFIAMLLTERFAAGRSQNSLVNGLARHGAEVSPPTLTGACAAAGTLLAPLEEAITARSGDSWHLHADETSWHVFAPARGRRPGEVVAVGVHCATRRSVVSLAQRAGMGGGIPGSDGLLRSERMTGGK